jgi:hypothetical protein
MAITNPPADPMDALRAHAVCAVCGKRTAGAWKKGDAVRYPRAHKAKDGERCPGSDQPAILAPVLIR